MHATQKEKIHVSRRPLWFGIFLHLFLPTATSHPKNRCIAKGHKITANKRLPRHWRLQHRGALALMDTLLCFASLLLLPSGSGKVKWKEFFWIYCCLLGPVTFSLWHILNLTHPSWWHFVYTNISPIPFHCYLGNCKWFKMWPDVY